MAMLVLLALLALPLSTLADAAPEEDPVCVRVGDFSYPLSLVQNSLDSLIKLTEASSGEILTEEQKERFAADIIDNFVGIGLIETKLTEVGRHDFTSEEEELMKSAAAGQYEELWQSVHQMMVKSGMDATEEQVVQGLEEEGYTLDSLYQECVVSERQRRAISLFVPNIVLSQEQVDEYYESQFLAPDRERYADNIAAYEREILNTDNEAFYTPEGYRAVRQILLEYPEEVAQALEPDREALEKAGNAVTGALARLTEVATTADDWSELDEPRAAYDAAMADMDAANRAYIDRRREVTLPLLQGTLDAIDERLEAGIDFKSLISKYSADVSERNVNGAGYPVHPESDGWPAEFVEAAMSLEMPGDVSEPVLTEKGVHILYYEGDIPAGEHVLTDEERELLNESALYYYQLQALTGLFEEWKPDYDIETYPERLKY